MFLRGDTTMSTARIIPDFDNRNASRVLRRILLRITAFPTFLDTANPSRDSLSSVGRTRKIRVGVIILWPLWKTRAKSLDFRMRWFAVKRLSCKSLSTRGTTCLDHPAAPNRFHASQKTVLLSPFSAIGLKRPFHDRNLLYDQSLGACSASGDKP